MPELVKKTDDEAVLAAMMVVVETLDNKPADNERYGIHQAARHVLWTFGDLNYGQRPGSFTETLIEAICRADVRNCHKLSKGFPIYTGFVLIAQNHEYGMAFLRSIAEYKGEPV